MNTPRRDALPRDEYVEQAHFFEIFRERADENVSAQELITQAIDEALTSTRLPYALEFLRGELLMTGRIGHAMERLPHYFEPFQYFVMQKAEEEKGRFTQPFALEILEREAEYRAGEPTPQGLFLYQFEAIARNRLGYCDGLASVAKDSMYDDDWRTWIGTLHHLLGTLDVAQLVYSRSAFYQADRDRRNAPRGPLTPSLQDAANAEAEPTTKPPAKKVLFGMQEGKIAKANRGKDPLYFFAALQRQLDYPAVPRPAAPSSEPIFHPALEARLLRIEKMISFIEAEQHNKLDLSKFYKQNETRKDD